MTWSNHNRIRRWILGGACLAAAFTPAIVYAAEPKGFATPPTATPVYRVAGSVSGASSGLVLANDGGDELAISGSDFVFSTPLRSGQGYSVTILTQPSGQTCGVRNGSGSVTDRSVTDVEVRCVSNALAPPRAQPTAPVQAPVAPPAEGADVGSNVLSGSISQIDRTWVCKTRVNLASVTVTITSKAPSSERFGIMLGEGCTGYIGSIKVTTALSDGVHVGNPHDLTIAGGSIACNGRLPEAHQDGIQVMGGSNVKFSHVTVACATANNSGFYVNDGKEGQNPPKAVIFDRGKIYAAGTSSAFVTDDQTNSGVTNSMICPSRYWTYRNGDDPKVVNVGNTFPTGC